MSKRTSEMIGRTAFGGTYTNWSDAVSTVDNTVPNYEFWSKLRRGKAKGYRLGSLFASPIANIMSSWIMGQGVKVSTGDPYTDELVAQMIDDNHSVIQDNFLYDSLTLGDGLIAVQPDGSLTPISPSGADIIPNMYDYRKLDQITTTVIMSDSSRKTSPQDDNRPSSVKIQDTWTRGARVLRVTEGGNTQERRFRNPIDQIPLVHFASGRETNETHGHPIYERLLYLFARYDNVINKSLDGVEVMGNPFLAIEGLDDPTQAKEANATHTEQYENPDGTKSTVYHHDVEDIPLWWLGKGASMKFVSPGAFTSEASKMLELLFLLMLQTCLIPEWVWGNAVNSSRASVGSQAPAFVRSVEGWRRSFAPSLKDMIYIWLKWKSLSDMDIVVPERITLSYPQSMPDDMQIMTERLRIARVEGLIDDVAFIKALNIVDNPEATVDLARKENQERRDDFDADIESAIDSQV